jgi:hypothetical protein
MAVKVVRRDFQTFKIIPTLKFGVITRSTYSCSQLLRLKLQIPSPYCKVTYVSKFFFKFLEVG